MRMPVHVGERLLHHAEYRDLDFLGQIGGQSGHGDVHAGVTPGPEAIGLSFERALEAVFGEP